MTPTLSSAPELARPVDGDAGQRSQPRERVRRQRRLVPCDAVHARLHQRLCRHRHRDSADDVGTARFLTIRQAGPADVVGGHDLHGPAALVLRLALQERVAAANQRSGTERRVHLMRGERDVVEMLRVVVRLDVDPAVRGELRGIDENPGPDRVRLARQTMDWLDEAGDVRGAADGQQPNAIPVDLEQPVHVVLVEPSVSA